jgi:hypothetical protein
MMIVLFSLFPSVQLLEWYQHWLMSDNLPQPVERRIEQAHQSDTAQTHNTKAALNQPADEAVTFGGVANPAELVLDAPRTGLF